jgi:hypothetical protein
MRKIFDRQMLCLMLALFTLTAAASAATVPEIHEFTSDGCSLFPDGNLEHQGLWCDCCFAHDIAYWRGGTQQERIEADDTLRDCVLERTRSKALAILMYDGVRTGGHPAFPTWYRWAYGWSYGRGYKALTDEEQQQSKKRLEEYIKKHPDGYCGKRSGTKTLSERERP